MSNISAGVFFIVSIPKDTCTYYEQTVRIRATGAFLVER
jgi:hypothetical protein